MIHNKYPIPFMTQLTYQVCNVQMYTNLDLKHGFYQIRAGKGNEWKPAFPTCDRHYQYQVMPFGLVNAQATFQTMMNESVREFLAPGVVVYINDILIYCNRVEKYIILVRKVLPRLCEDQMASCAEKSMFDAKMVDFWNMLCQHIS